MFSACASTVRKLVRVAWKQRSLLVTSTVGSAALVTYAFYTNEPVRAQKLITRPAPHPAGNQPPKASQSAAKPQHELPYAERLQKAVARIREAQPQLDISLDSSHLESHARDVSFHEPHLPDVVIYPRSAEEVAAVLRSATEFRIPVVPYAGATSLEGHIVPRFGGITVDCSQMNRILAVRPTDMDCDVEPGVPWEALNEHLRPYGLFFAPDPGPGACIGGMIGTSCSGTNAARYGTMRENVLSLEVVLPTGEIVQQTRSRARKSSAGYDLTRLFVGSEGTLGIATKATLRLRPLPAYRGVAKCTFERLEDAAATVQDVLGPPLAVSIGRCELMDRLAVQAVNLSTNQELELDESRHLLLFELVGESMQVIREQAHRVKMCAERHHVHEWRMAAAPHCLESLSRPAEADQPQTTHVDALHTNAALRANLDGAGDARVETHPGSAEHPEVPPPATANHVAADAFATASVQMPEQRGRVADAVPRNRSTSEVGGQTQAPTWLVPESPDDRQEIAASRAASVEDIATFDPAPGAWPAQQPGKQLTADDMDAAERRLLEERERLWRSRKVAYWSAYELRPGAEIWTTDVAVPLSKLADVLRETQQDIEQTNRAYTERHGSLVPLVAPLVAHAADGNFHLLMLVDPKDPVELERAQQVNDRLVQRAIAAGGTCTGEHGIGEGKRQYLVPELGLEAVDLMRRIKATIDPAGIMNPGKVLPPEVGDTGELLLRRSYEA
jgi:FAD/FMN-containing dehydrogenase